MRVKQGLGVVLSGSIDRDGDGYGISVKAVRTVTGEVIAEDSDDASNKEEVVEVATRLMTGVRHGARRPGIGIGTDVRDGQPVDDLA